MEVRITLTGPRSRCAGQPPAQSLILQLLRWSREARVCPEGATWRCSPRPCRLCRHGPAPMQVRAAVEAWQGQSLALPHLLLTMQPFSSFSAMPGNARRLGTRAWRTHTPCGHGGQSVGGWVGRVRLAQVGCAVSGAAAPTPRHARSLLLACSAEAAARVSSRVLVPAPASQPRPPPLPAASGLCPGQRPFKETPHQLAADAAGDAVLHFVVRDAAAALEEGRQALVRDACQARHSHKAACRGAESAGSRAEPPTGSCKPAGLACEQETGSRPAGRLGRGQRVLSAGLLEA